MRALVLFISMLAACSDPADEPGVGDASRDAEAAADAEREAGAQPDVARPADVTADAGTDATADLGGTACDATCRTIDLALTLGGTSVAADRAFYGLTSPAMGESGGWELHVEVYRGGSATCPGPDSPTPDQTVIITGMPLRPAPAVLTEADGLVVSLLDFEGALTTDIATPASGESVTLAAYVVCEDCAGDDPDGWLALDVTAPLTGGEISGHVFATHCASLDAR